MKVTKEILENQIKILNSQSNNIYGLCYAYGKVQVVQICQSGGQRQISPFGTKREISNILWALNEYGFCGK